MINKHHTSIVSKKAVLGSNVTIGPYCIINENVKIGKNVICNANAVIGSDGFSFVSDTGEGIEKVMLARSDQVKMNLNHYLKVESLGSVDIHDNVEIGASCCIDRGTISNTVIGEGTKIDNLVHVAHNCNIGESCAFAAQVGLAGGVKVGKRVILAGQVGVANQVSIGDGAIATAQTGIASNINSGEVVSSSPAIDNKLYLKASAIYKRLPEMYKILRNLQKK